MLVLTRKENERVVIGNDIVISVVSIGPGRVKIGIEAPKWMAIDREEVHARKQFQARNPTTRPSSIALRSSTL